MEIFWDSHNPTSQSWSRQYRTALFYHDEEQKGVAEITRNRLAATIKGEIATGVLPFTGFYLAEDYHQKHNLRGHSELLDELSTRYPSVEELISSTAVARVNGYLGGNGTCDQLQSEMDDLGLSAKGTKRLIEAVCGGKRTGTSCSAKNCLP